LNSGQHTLNIVRNQVNVDHSSDRGQEGTWQMKILLLAAAAVGLGAILAGNLLPDVTRYLRIRRM
jgi:hypothetical protein